MGVYMHARIHKRIHISLAYLLLTLNLVEYSENEIMNIKLL